MLYLEHCRHMAFDVVDDEEHHGSFEVGSLLVRSNVQAGPADWHSFLKTDGPTARGQALHQPKCGSGVQAQFEASPPFVFFLCSCVRKPQRRTPASF